MIEVNILEQRQLPNDEIYTKYNVIDQSFINKDLDKNDPRIHEICEGTFRCHKDEITEILQKEALESYNRHTAKKVNLMSNTKFIIDTKSGELNGISN